MADNSDTQEPSSLLRQIFRNRRALWWTLGAVALIALVGVTWLERKRIHWSLPKWTASPPEWLLPLGLVAGGLLALAILWKVPQWQVRPVSDLAPKERFDRVNEARKTLATILGGITLLAGGFLTWRNVKVAQDTLKVSQDSALISGKTLEVSKEGQITDRFTKAIEQLGAVNEKGKKKLEVRLGGIYALEGIANESEELHWSIMEVLCTYVRENAPAPSKPKIPLTEAVAVTVLPPTHPAADIQAILNVLGRRDREYEQEDQHLDLRRTDLRGADLRGANLGKANLGGAILADALFDHANLSAVMLNEAHLEGATLMYANLSLANLSGSHLKRAHLYAANLSEARILDADLSEVLLSGSNLSGAWIGPAHLHGTFLDRANLSGVKFAGADLSGVYLNQANLSGVEFVGADLSGVDLNGANLRDARYLSQEQIDTAKGDSTTQLPPDLHMPESWKK